MLCDEPITLRNELVQLFRLRDRMSEAEAIATVRSFYARVESSSWSGQSLEQICEEFNLDPSYLP